MFLVIRQIGEIILCGKIHLTLKNLNVWLFKIVQMKEKSRRPTHQCQVYSIYSFLQHRTYPRGRLPLCDDFFHRVKIVIHLSVVRHRGRESVNLRHEGHVQLDCIQSTRQQAADIIVLQSWPIVQFITWNSPDRPRWSQISDVWRWFKFDREREEKGHRIIHVSPSIWGLRLSPAGSHRERQSRVGTLRGYYCFLITYL